MCVTTITVPIMFGENQSMSAYGADKSYAAALNCITAACQALGSIANASRDVQNALDHLFIAEKFIQRKAESAKQTREESMGALNAKPTSKSSKSETRADTPARPKNTKPKKNSVWSDDETDDNRQHIKRRPDVPPTDEELSSAPDTDTSKKINTYVSARPSADDFYKTVNNIDSDEDAERARRANSPSSSSSD